MKDWQAFLDSQTIQPLSEGDHICALPGLGLLYVGGVDAEEFLQNQLSNDIALIDANTAQLSSASISKGRMYGIFRVIQIDGGYLLLMPRSILADVLQRLHKFVLRSQVVMADISDDFARFCISSRQPDVITETDFPQAINGVSQSDSLICLRLHNYGDQQRYLMLSNNPKEAADLWQAWSENLSVNDESAWLHDEILSGIPAIHPQTQEAFVLQMANLDLLDAVSFKKGCYPGQEIIARTRYLGKIKRRMFIASVETDQCPAPGDELSADSDAKPDGSGKVVQAVSLGDNRCLLQFIGLIDKAESGSLHLSGQPDNQLKLLQMPYPLNDQK